MEKTLYDYQDIIKKLPIKNSYTKEELLTREFLIAEEKNIAIYYAPHNEYINPKAKVFIVGITPGFQQMNTAVVTARVGFEQGKSIAEIQHECKVAARFSGSLRKNIISMLDELELGVRIGLQSSSELFQDRDNLLHTVSLIPYPVFVKGQNYTGHTPKLIKSEFLMNFARKNFIEELSGLENREQMIFIPLGKAVEEVLCELESQSIIVKDQILRGFPHPSGANVNRLAQFEESRAEMMRWLTLKLR